MPTQRYKMTIAYRGTAYHGWQFQLAQANYNGPKPPEGEGLPTIQEKLTRVVQGVIGHPVTIVGSSRTDTGVHAKGQIAHFDTDQLQIPTEGMRRAINHRLPDDILVRSIEPVPDSFHAILSTRTKRYQYNIWNAYDRPLFAADLSWHRWHELDVDAMIAAAAHLEGEHDFASFARPGHKRFSTVRSIYECSVSYRKPQLVIGVEGNGFLWNMVRIMVGTLVEVGLGRFRPEEIPRMLAAKDRTAAGSTAPPHGLFLHWIWTWKEDETHAVPDESELVEE